MHKLHFCCTLLGLISRELSHRNDCKCWEAIKFAVVYSMTHIAIFGRERPIIDLQYTSQPKGTRVQGLLVSPQNSQNLQN